MTVSANRPILFKFLVTSSGRLNDDQLAADLAGAMLRVSIARDQIELAAL